MPHDKQGVLERFEDIFVFKDKGKSGDGYDCEPDVWNDRFKSLKETDQIDGIFQFLESEIDKAREEERKRIEEVFEKEVPPHGLTLEDGIWLKRLLNRAFNHKQ